MEEFLPNKGNYRQLIVYQVAESIYDTAFYFAHHYLARGDRTIDQMIQAARSCKQNIVEGSAASTTSSETELKLMNVARASLQELLQDYEDYLRVHSMEKWQFDDPRCVQTRKVLRQHNESSFYCEHLPQRSAETIANIAITMIHQEDVMLRRLIERLKQNFLVNGGIREQMSAARRDYRRKNGSW
ncbi:four helix bundle suffix domain-containing protein [Prevotella koreensis]|uniref:four helix bundle suffix domain-containing protein n=1 Tax=Prevotella koreensis TaxID=2490854 RepID=UPI003FA03552